MCASEVVCLSACVIGRAVVRLFVGVGVCDCWFVRIVVGVCACGWLFVCVCANVCCCVCVRLCDWSFVYLAVWLVA